MRRLPTEAQVAIHLKKTVELMSEFCEKEFGFVDGFKPVYQITFIEGRRSCGGSLHTDALGHYPWVSFGLHEVVTYPVIAFGEYDSYETDMILGGFKTNQWKLFINGLVAHELSHAVQHMIPNIAHMQHKIVEGRHAELGRVEKGHGEMFKNIYRRLREEFINPHVPMSARGSLINQQFDKRSAPISAKALEQLGPLANLKFQFHLETATIIDYRSKNHLYPYIILTDGNERFRMSFETLLASDPGISQVLGLDETHRRTVECHNRQLTFKNSLAKRKSKSG